MIEKIGQIPKTTKMPVFCGTDIESKPSLEQKPDTVELSNKEEPSENKNTKLAVIAAAVLSAIGIGILIYKHKNPTKSIKNAGESLANSHTNPHTKPNKPDIEPDFKKEADEYLEQLERENQQKLQEIANSDTRNNEWVAQERAKQEKEYSDFWKRELDIRDKKVAEQLTEELTPKAEEFIEEIQQAWGNEAARLTRIFDVAEQNGFNSLKGTPAILKDGTHVICLNDKKSDFVYSYFSKDGKTLDKVVVFKANKKFYSAEPANFNHLKQSETVSICQFDSSGKNTTGTFVFAWDRKNPQFEEYVKSFDLRKEGEITYIKRAGAHNGEARYEVGFQGPDYYCDSFWIKKPV